LKKREELTAETKYELLKTISYKIRDTLDLDVILNQLLDLLESVMRYDAAGVFVLSQDIIHPRYHFPNQHIASIAQRGYDKRPPESDAMLMEGKGLVGYVIKTGESLLVPDVKLDKRYIAGREKTKSEMVVPIMKNGKPTGAFDVESDRQDAYNDIDLEILSFFADAAAISIEKAMLHQQILRKKKIEEQLQIASEVQTSLLPAFPPEVKGYNFAGICIPTYEIGGDYFDYFKLDENNIAIAIADVSGDGIPAALVMAAFRALLHSHSKSILNPSKLMTLINNQLSEYIRKRDFITAFYGIINIKENSISYTNCGHTEPLILRKNGDIEKLKTCGPSLCLVDNASFKTAGVKLHNEDKIILYTDGVTEIFNKNSEEFGQERLINVIKKNPTESSFSLIKKIESETKNFCKDEFYNDDYTIVVVSRQ
jgi:serine phosphatase RsbU (regulator of sigma subunit)